MRRRPLRLFLLCTLTALLLPLLCLRGGARALQSLQAHLHPAPVTLAWATQHYGLPAAVDTGEVAAQWAPARDTYLLDLTLDPIAHTLQGQLALGVCNRSDDVWESLHLSLFANSYAREEYGIFFPEDAYLAYPNGFSPGGIALHQVQVDGIDAPYTLTGTQGQILQVTPRVPLQPGETLVLYLQFTVTQGNCLGRFGYGPNTQSWVNCIPILNVYGPQGWVDDAYTAVGDPFYSNVADYYAFLHTPAGYTVASTGLQQTTPAPGGGLLHQILAPARRDFGFVAAKDMTVCTLYSADGVQVSAYTAAEDAALAPAAAQTALEALELFQSCYGPYPYGALRVVESDFFIGGMEYPGMVMVDASLYNNTDAYLMELICVHEVAHQWWYAVVGSDQLRHPFLDEALAEFSTRLFYRNHPGTPQQDYLAYCAMLYASARQSGPALGVDSPVQAFPDSLRYSAWVYDRGADVLQSVQARMGEEAFFAALGQYYRTCRMTLATPDDLYAALQAHGLADAAAYLQAQFALP